MKKYPDRNFVLVGHSLGGLFAIYVAQQLGDVIHKLIFVNTGLAPKRVAMKAMQQMQINRIAKFIKKIGMRMLFSGKLPKWLTRSLYFTDDTPEHIKIELSKHKVRENRSFLMEHFNSKSVWKSHALYLMAEYFYSKDQKQKSKEFFNQIANLEDANPDIKLQAQKRLNRDLSD